MHHDIAALQFIRYMRFLDQALLPFEGYKKNTPNEYTLAVTILTNHLQTFPSSYKRLRPSRFSSRNPHPNLQNSFKSALTPPTDILIKLNIHILRKQDNNRTSTVCKVSHVL